MRLFDEKNRDRKPCVTVSLTLNPNKLPINPLL
jgi:hypothetical protein